MASVSEERYVFETEWLDTQADLIRKYLFTFYPKDGTIDMVSFRFANLTRLWCWFAHHTLSYRCYFSFVVWFEKPKDVLETNCVSRRDERLNLHRLNHHSLFSSAQDRGVRWRVHSSAIWIKALENVCHDQTGCLYLNWQNYRRNS